MIRRRCHALVVLVASVAVLATLVTPVGRPAGAQTSPGVVDRFVYDEAGRLRAAIDDEGDVARYRYDRLGNLLAIERSPASALSVIQLLPSAAAVGELVTVYGTGFSATASANEVTFGSVPATVESASANRLSVTVPAGAASAPVTVRVGTASASSEGSFTVLAPPPTVSGVSPTAAATGASVTVSGSGFDADPVRNAVWFGNTAAPVTAATATALTVTVPPGLGSGLVSVTTPAGTSTATGPQFFTVPAGMDPATACPQSATVGATATPPCANGLVAVELTQAKVYEAVFSAPCAGTGPATVHRPDGTAAGTVAAACGGARLRFAAASSAAHSVTTPAAVQVADCVGCAAPAETKITTNPNDLCTCTAMAFHAVVDAAVGRGRTDAADPVDLASGSYIDEHADLAVGDAVGTAGLTRVYSSSIGGIGPFGAGGTHSYDLFLSGACNGRMHLNLPGGGQVPFDHYQGGGGCIHLVFFGDDDHDKHQARDVAGEWFGSVLEWEGVAEWAVIRRPDGTVFRFDRFGSLERIVDRNGNTTSIVRRPRANGRLAPIAFVRTATGRWLRFEYAPDCDTTTDECRITRVSDNLGRSVTYGYDAQKRLDLFTDLAGRQWRYRYEDARFPTKRTAVVAEPEGTVLLANAYDASGRVATQTEAGPNPPARPIWSFAYTGAAGAITATEVTDPAGVRRRVTFNAEHFATADTRYLGVAGAEQTATLERQPATGAITRATLTDAAYPTGRVTRLEYNPDGLAWSPTGSAPADDQLVKAVHVESTAGTYTTAYAYTPWVFGQVRGVTLPGARTSSYDYDAAGNLTLATDADGHRVALSYDVTGAARQAYQPGTSSWTRPTLVYAHGAVAEAWDQTARARRFVTDGAGRPLVERTPAGSRTTRFYNPDNTVARVVEPTGAVTQYRYGRFGLSELEDDAANLTTWAYHPDGRLQSRTDAFAKTEYLAYLDDGRLRRHTARRGVVTDYSYEPATARLAQIGYGADGAGGYESTVAYAYDGADRLRQVIDSTGGTTTFSFDDLDRQSRVDSPRGAIDYGYDPTTARLARVTPLFRPPTTYTWRPNDALESVTRAGATTTVAYDTTGRPDVVTLPNGTRQDYAYDPAGRPTRIDYRHPSDPAKDGAVTYTHGQDGWVETVGGSLNPYVLPAAATATYTKNRLTSWNGWPAAHDDDGNMTQHGLYFFTWNARGELVQASVAYGGNGTFAYDGLGQRHTRRLSGQAEERFLHDRGTVIQEQDATGAPTADHALAGLDAHLTRSAGGTTSAYLTDALGSTLALADGAGDLATTYRYTPTGVAAASGATSANPFRFTGRDDDSAVGLQYFRARYYHPELGRFLSEDPLGLAAGANLYTYPGNNPVNGTDPAGTTPLLLTCLSGALTQVGIEVFLGMKPTIGNVARSAAVGCLVGLAARGLGKWVDDVLSARRAPQAAGFRVGLQSTGQAPSSAVLGENLVASGVARPANSAAHHIVAGGAGRAAPARAVLDRFGIDINRAANGVFLPANRAAANTTGRAVHSTLHTNRYYAEVNRLLGQATSRQDVLDTLDFIRGELLAGRAL